MAGLCSTKGQYALRHSLPILMALLVSGCRADAAHQLAYEYQIPGQGNLVSLVDIAGDSQPRSFPLGQDGSLTSVVGWTPDGEQLILQSQQDWEYYLFDLASSAWGACISCGVERGDGMAFSPTMQQAVISMEDGLYLVSLDTQESRKIADMNGTVSVIGWSPDERFIIFMDWSTSDIYRINLGGSGRVNLTGALQKYQIFTARLSPDGDKVAFHVSHAGLVHLMVANSDGSGASSLATVSPQLDADWSSETINSAVEWSPDGKQVAFNMDMSLAFGDYDVYVINADGTGLTNLTQNPANDWGPEWSPDGKLIAFVSERDGNQDIWVMERDGSNPVNVTSSPGVIEYHPFWQP